MKTIPACNYVITHPIMDYSLSEIRILSLRDKRSLLVVAIFLFQDCSIYFLIPIVLLGLWKIAPPRSARGKGRTIYSSL